MMLQRLNGFQGKPKPTMGFMNPVNEEIMWTDVVQVGPAFLCFLAAFHRIGMLVIHGIHGAESTYC